MSQPIDTAYVEVKPDLDRFAAQLAAKLSAALSRVQASVDRSMRDMSNRAGTSGGHAGDLYGREFTRASQRGITRLRSTIDEQSRRPVKVAVDVDRGATRRLFSSAFAELAGSLSRANQNLGTALTNVTTNLWNLIPALTAAAGAMAFTVPAAYLLGGALGALPAIISGLGATIGTLALGFHGIADGFKQTAGGGGGAARSLTAVRSAERALTRAQQDARDAQDDLNRARKEAAERLQDLTRDLNGARISERRAALDVADAEKELAAARASGNVDEITRAQLAYDEAGQSLDEARDRTADLAAEQADAARKGVEGSDEVTRALRRQREATEQVKDAQLALREAQKSGGGGGGVAAQVTKLAPAARQFVNAIKSLQPAFESLRLHVQERLFSGIGGAVVRLARVWLPQLRTSLGGMADTFNSLFKTLTVSLSRPEFVRNIAAGIESVRRLVQRVGEAVAGPLVDAFGRLARAAGPFLDTVGDELAKLIEGFSAWIAQLDKTGSLDAFFTTAGGYFRDLVDMLKDLASIAGSVLSILFGEQAVTASPWVGLRDALDRIAAWFRDPQNQETVRGWIHQIQEFGEWLVTEGIPAFRDFVATISGWVATVQGWVTNFTAFKDQVVATVSGLPGQVLAALQGLPGQVADLFTRVQERAAYWAGFAVGRVVGFWRDLPGKVASVLANLPERVAGFFREIPGKATGALSGLPDKMYNAGRDAIYGLWNGMKSLLPWLRDRILGFAGSVIQGFKDGFDSRSPSRRMAREVGAPITAGVAVGMDRNQGPLVAARRRMVAMLSAPVDAGTVRASAASLSAVTAVPAVAPRSPVDALLGNLSTRSDQPIYVNLTVQLGNEVIDQRIERIAGTAVARNNTVVARGLNYRPRTV